ncbi:MAG: hypothetical protein Kow0092_27530 [Deferrisomatales bacterium]
MDKVFLYPGEAVFAREPTRIDTLLGSCVAVCLYDRARRWGGMNHYMLPRRGDGRLPPGKYGDHAIRSLLSLARAAGSRKEDLCASVYGGARVAGHLGPGQGPDVLEVGARNVEVAREMLERFRVPVVREEVGGTRGRKLSMNSATNEVRVQEVASHAVGPAPRVERAGPRIRVLVVDDSPFFRSLVRRAVESEGDVEVVAEAANAQEARERLLDADPDVLCLDIVMPGFDGIAFLRKVMAHRPIPTVILSAVARQGSAERRGALEAGAVAVLDKADLEIYRGPEALRARLLPELRRAAATPVQRLPAA